MEESKKKKVLTYDELQRRRLQEYVFGLEELREKSEELAIEHEELKLSQELLIAILTGTIHGICLIKDRSLVWCNKALTDILGWQQEEVIGKSLEIVYPSKEEFLKMGEVIYGRLKQEKVLIYEYDFLHKDGHPVPCLLTGRVLDDKDLSKGYVFSVTDITERKRVEEALKRAYEELEQRVAERTRELVEANERLKGEIAERGRMEKDSERIQAQLLHAQKMEAVGTLAGGIAHDFNNLLQGIFGNISIAQLYTKPGDSVSTILGEAEKALVRARDLTQRLITFSRGGEPVTDVLSIYDPLKDSINFALSGSNVRCGYALTEGLWEVEIDVRQIGQVINNIVINSIEAMPEGGNIVVRGENTRVGPNESLPVPEGRYVRITITDEGNGIPKENLGQIFDPYFSTKDMGSKKGMGLGLAICHSIVEKHGGYIFAESVLGIGTSIQIYLPAYEGGLEDAKGPEARPRVKKGNVLVMDDEEVVIKVADRMLSHLEYDASFVRNGSDAVDAYAKAMAEGKPYDVVILDLTIPGGMGGKATVRRLLEMDPQVRAIVSSGYSDDAIMADFEEHGFKGAIAKPYKVDELAEIIDGVMKKG